MTQNCTELHRNLEPIHTAAKDYCARLAQTTAYKAFLEYRYCFWKICLEKGIMGLPFLLGPGAWCLAPRVGRPGAQYSGSNCDHRTLDLRIR